jgi:serine-type D-Ala-D-Ala carboxypeptidase/endopeptidase (penicillin-binding protein 4)
VEQELAHSGRLFPRAGVVMLSRLLALVLLLLPAPAKAGVKETVAALAPSGIVLVMDAKGNELVAQNADKPFVPASVTKIVTSWLALEVLGADYRFETRFYLDAKRVLYIKGGGDPYLISEELAPLATELIAKIGKAPITGIVVDASYYPSNLRIPGIENDDTAYDALNSALGAIRWSPRRTRLRSPRSPSLGSARRAPRTERAASVLAKTLRSVSNIRAS